MSALIIQRMIGCCEPVRLNECQSQHGIWTLGYASKARMNIRKHDSPGVRSTLDLRPVGGRLSLRVDGIKRKYLSNCKTWLDSPHPSEEFAERRVRHGSTRDARSMGDARLSQVEHWECAGFVVPSGLSGIEGECPLSPIHEPKRTTEMDREMPVSTLPVRSAGSAGQACWRPGPTACGSRRR